MNPLSGVVSFSTHSRIGMGEVPETCDIIAGPRWTFRG